jgi:tetratricopeptide (TPR) repeat protein
LNETHQKHDSEAFVIVGNVMMKQKGNINKGIQEFLDLKNDKYHVHALEALTCDSMMVADTDLYLQVAAREYTLEVETRNGDQEHPSARALKILTFMSDANRRKADYQNALIICNIVYQVRMSSLGENNIHTLREMRNLANLYKDKGDLNLAQYEYEKTLKGLELIVGEQDEDTSDVLANLAIVHNYKGENRLAIAYFERALKVWKKLGNHQRMISTTNNLATTYARTYRWEKAISYYQET